MRHTAACGRDKRNWVAYFRGQRTRELYLAGRGTMIVTLPVKGRGAGVEGWVVVCEGVPDGLAPVGSDPSGVVADCETLGLESEVSSELRRWTPHSCPSTVRPVATFKAMRTRT